MAALALLAVEVASLTAGVSMRRESDPRFAVDGSFQDTGGVQYFYALIRPEAAPDTDSVFISFRPFDVDDVWGRLEEPLTVVLSRLVYTVEKDVSFFNEQRARDIDYINAIATKAKVTSNADGSYRVGQTPANTFSIEFLDTEDLHTHTSPGLTRLFELSGIEGRPASVVIQRNRDFARVMGVRTAEASMTWTAHYAVSEGKTRIVVFTMSYLRTLPPFFLGGERRIFRESTEGARALIERLRAFVPREACAQPLPTRQADALGERPR
jgi:hypothetical protein